MGNMIKSIITLISLVISMAVFAQDLPLTNEAAKLCQEKNFEAAKGKIAEALATGESEDAYSWYVAGFIYKECYKNLESGKRESPYRVLAAEHFEKSLELDKPKNHASNIRIGMKYIATTYFNDALMRIREMDNGDEVAAEKDFNTFRRLMRVSEPGCDLNQYDKDYHQTAGQQFFDLWKANPDNEDFARKSLAHFQEAIQKDGDDCMLHYNIGVLQYNRAVFLYRSINAETELDVLMDIQIRASGLLKQEALPEMEKADKLCPNHGEILKGLLYIHKGLEHESDVKYFKDEIERLINEGQMKTLTPGNK